MAGVTVVCHPSVVRPSIVLPYKKTFSRNLWKKVMPNLVEMYVSLYLWTTFLLRLHFFFHLRWHGTICEEKNQMTHICLKVHTGFTSPNVHILLGRVSTKIVQRIVKFQILDFCLFFSVSINHMRVEVWNDISSESTLQINFPKFMCTPRQGLYQMC